MEKYIKKLLLLLLISLSFNSYGEWTKTNMDVNGVSYYIDFETVKQSKGYVLWWEMRDLPESNEDGDMSAQIFIKGDCESSRNTFLQIVTYKKSMGDGKAETFGEVLLTYKT